jgi:hypothetical protein
MAGKMASPPDDEDVVSTGLFMLSGLLLLIALPLLLLMIVA